MSEYRPTEYVVDFGDCRSNQFVRLNMALIEQNSAKLGERIVRCRDCRYNAMDTDGICYRFDHEHFNRPDGYCSWAVRRDEWPTTS